MHTPVRLYECTSPVTALCHDSIIHGPLLSTSEYLVGEAAMDELAAFSAGIVIVNAAAALIWMSWVAWHRMHGEHVNWW